MRHPSTMGIHKVLFAAIIGVPVVAAGVPAAMAQTASQPGWVPRPTVSPAGTAYPAAADEPDPAAKPARKRRYEPVSRDPVRREVIPTKSRRVARKSTPATAADEISPPPEQSSAVAQSPAPAQSTSQPPPARQTPRVIGVPPTSASPPSPATVQVQPQSPTSPGAPAQAQPPQQASRDAWSEADIKLARTHCEAVLRGVDATLAPEDPIKQGECGSAVVYKVSSIGKGPVVELSPPVTLTCDMIASLDKWVKRDVQPQARSLLGSSVVKIETMSSYSCRNAYGRIQSRLSEHGRANAIDIASFHTAKDSANVLVGWGPTARELRAIAAKQEAERAALAAARSKEQSSSVAQSPAPPRSGSGPASTTSADVPGIMAPLPGTGKFVPPAAFGLAPTHLGGPKSASQSSGQSSAQAPDAAAAKAAAAAESRRTFLRQIHSAACKHFGTVLGPEANNAHKNHFHLDMAPRKTSNFCE